MAGGATTGRTGGAAMFGLVAETAGTVADAGSRDAIPGGGGTGGPTGWGRGCGAAGGVGATLGAVLCVALGAARRAGSGAGSLIGAAGATALLAGAKGSG